MTPELEARARTAFAEAFGAAPEAVAFAPGRVNLIGEHVDYNDGLVLPMPVPQGTAVAWDKAGGPGCAVFAADFAEMDRFDRPDKPRAAGWRSYVRGMAAHWGPVPEGLRLAIAGDLPRGSGLSSSASLCVAVGRALSAARGEAPDPRALARAAQQTEHDFAGVACGIMDQMAVAAGTPGAALLLDCRDLETRTLALPQDWAVLVVDSGVTRGLVDGEYNARRRQCEAAAKALGVAALRDATQDAVAGAPLDAATRRRAAHVVAEIARTEAAAKAVQHGDLAALGTILRAGHASLRDQFEVSVPAVDALVADLDARIGALGGARMTGAGFGGSVVAVCERSRIATVTDGLPHAWRQAF